VREIGVRLALGASPGRVMRSIVGQGILVAGIGLAIGLAGAYGLTRLLSSLLFQTDPLDIATFVAMSAALLVVALLASYLPARRAAGVSPLESLRAE
jgi:putative ABC transport system permease protein